MVLVRVMCAVKVGRVVGSVDESGVLFRENTVGSDDGDEVVVVVEGLSIVTVSACRLLEVEMGRFCC